MKQKYLIGFLAIILLTVVIHQVAFAVPKVKVNPADCASKKIDDVTGMCTLDNPAGGYLYDESKFADILAKVVQILVVFAGGIAVVFLIIGGYRYVVSRGNEEAMESAKKTITAAILGIVIIIMAYAIVAIVNQLVTGPPPK